MSHETTITIPMEPPRECNPNNANVGWRKKAAAVKAFRWAAKAAAVNALNTPGSGASAFCGDVFSRVTLDVVIAWSGRRKKLDDDNARASCKAAIDGLSDALWSGQDGHVVMGELRQVMGAGETIVTLRIG